MNNKSNTEEMKRLKAARSRKEWRARNPEKRKQSRKEWRARNPEKRKRSRKEWHARNREKHKAEHKPYIGIDGEGFDIQRGNKSVHTYVYMGANNEDGSMRKQVHDWRWGLRTHDCLEFILELPKFATIFAYAFNYDLTKMLADLPDEKLYHFFRPELRQRHGDKAVWGPIPVEWEGPNGVRYLLNYQGTKFTVEKVQVGVKGRKKLRRIVWDIFKFYQSKFVNTLKEWRVGNEALWERMQEMKEKRDVFTSKMRDQIAEYCLEECQCMAQLARKLTDSHAKVGLRLKVFYGAGSSGAAMLDTMGIKDKIVDRPEIMREAVAQSFFGGRFENSRIGRIEGTIYNYDISSAYPYQTYFLPCLEHGEWRLTDKEEEIGSAKAALVHYGYSKVKPTDSHWGALPFREADGSISFPIRSGGSWTWRSEFQAAQRAFPHILFREAWIFESWCNCQPFKKIAEYYNERCRIGKEGPGIVIKLGINSCYGKLAQSVGRGKYNCWIWASMITSGTRAQLLDMLALHKDRANLVMMATDGIFTHEEIEPPIPSNTGTSATGKPLGGWEKKTIEGGIFVARPGIYFPIKEGTSVKEVKGRGLGKGVVLEYGKKIIEHYETHGLDEDLILPSIRRFCGGKTSISFAPGTGKYTRANGEYVGGPAYGQWIEREVKLSFFPMPKRDKVLKGNFLRLRSFPRSQESYSYDKAVVSKETRDLRDAKTEELEQPDCGDEYDDLVVET
jgi:DNA polymerase type B, organellar and viral